MQAQVYFYLYHTRHHVYAVDPFQHARLSLIFHKVLSQEKLKEYSLKRMCFFVVVVVFLTREKQGKLTEEAEFDGLGQS